MPRTQYVLRSRGCYFIPASLDGRLTRDLSEAARFDTVSEALFVLQQRVRRVGLLVCANLEILEVEVVDNPTVTITREVR